MFSTFNQELSGKRLSLMFLLLFSMLIITISFGYRDYSRYRNKVITSNGQVIQGLAKIIARGLRADMETYRKMFGEEWTVVVSAPIVDVPATRRVEVWWLLTIIIVILLLATLAIYSVVTRIGTS